MDWRACCAAVVPCLNEERSIEALVTAVRRLLAVVIAVDDGSSDRTAECAARAGAVVIKHSRNSGKGAALRSGWLRAASDAFEWVLTLDGDGQHSAEDIPLFFEHAERTGASLVVGNRLHDHVHMPWLRRFVNRWMSRRLSKVAGQNLPDSQCGFRLVKVSALQSLSLTTDHFEIESEMLLAFARARLPIAFVPIRALYKSEQSKIHPVKDTLRWFRWWRSAR